MSETVYYYKVFCITDNKFEHVWSTESPTVCPINNQHQIDLDSITIEREISKNIVKVQEENIPTGENFMCESPEINAQAGPDIITNVDFTWPFPINVLGIKLALTDENIHDYLTLSVSPETPVGALTGAILSGVNTIPVTDTVLDNVMLGYGIHLSDGVSKKNFCGRVTKVDKVNKTIDIETSPTDGFSAGNLILMTVYVINNYKFSAPGIRVIGDGKIGASHVPSGTIVRVSYTNKSDQAKSLSSQLEYLY